jgi:hypothetical protein
MNIMAIAIFIPIPPTFCAVWWYTVQRRRGWGISAGRWRWKTTSSDREMRTHPILLGLCALMLAAAPGMAQPAIAQQQPEPELLDRADQRPFDALMDVRAELQLSDAQVSRLQGIAARLEATNRPLREELLRRWHAFREQRRAELLRMTPEQRQAELARVRAQGRPPVPDELRPLVQRIRGNVAGARREAGTVLTPRQKARARQLLRERRQDRLQNGRGGRMGRGGMGRGRARAGVP